MLSDAKMSQISKASHYRIRAAEFAARARNVKERHLQVDYAQIARGYIFLARLADKNSQTDLAYETPRHSTA